MAAAYGISPLPPTTVMDIPKRCFYFAKICETKQLKFTMFESPSPYEILFLCLQGMSNF
jgi:hypothetical protein